jgi:hypothetical protein
MPMLLEQDVRPDLTVGLLKIFFKLTARGAATVSAAAGLSPTILGIAGALPIPGIGLATATLQAGAKQLQEFRIERRLREKGLWPDDSNGRLEHKDLAGKLVRALYEDILQWLRDNPTLHLRLLLDGFERLQSSQRRDDSQRHIEQFIGPFAHSEPETQGRFRVLIFGRNRLQWNELYRDPDWERCWNLHLLGGLAEEDAREFLVRVSDWYASHGVSEKAEWLRMHQDPMLIAATEGHGHEGHCFPYYLNLAVELVELPKWHNCAELDLGCAPAQLQDRFFNYLEPHELRALISWRSVASLMKHCSTG